MYDARGTAAWNAIRALRCTRFNKRHIISERVAEHLQPGRHAPHDAGSTGTDDAPSAFRDALSCLASSPAFEFVLRIGGAKGAAAGNGNDDYGNNYENYDCHTGATAANGAVFALSSVAVRDPPPERPVAARGSDTDENKTYFTRSPACRLACTVDDASVLEVITSRMLGPRTDFGVVCVDVMRAASGARAAARLLANVTNSVQTPDTGVEVGLVVVDAVDAKTGRRMGAGDLRALSDAV